MEKGSKCVIAMSNLCPQDPSHNSDVKIDIFVTKGINVLTLNIGRKASGELLAPITVIKNCHPYFALSKDDMGSTSTLKHANEINIYSIMRYLL